MKGEFIFAALGLSTFAYNGCSQPSGSQPPNIVLIIGDDIGWNDLSCYGNNQFQTPNIDRIANEGIKFTNAFLTTSSSSPTRSCIITGRYPHNTGAAELHTWFPASVEIFPELLKKAGYYTAQAGKWHMSPHAKRGFDLVRDEGPQVNGDGGEKLWVNLLRERPKEKPFFMWFASFDAHRPWGANPFDREIDTAKVTVPPYLINDESTIMDMAKYYGEIVRFDHFIGEVENELRRQNVLDNTLIIILSDNGRPFPRCKTWLYDDGIKTPLIIKWEKGIAKKGAVSESLVSAVDLAPTILEVAGAEPLTCAQGESMVPLFHDPSASIRNYVFAEQNWHDYETYERMVRTKDFMYLFNGRPALTHGSNGGLDNVPAFNALLKARDEGKLTAIQKDIFLSPRPVEAFFDCRKDPLQEHNLIDNPAYATEINHLKEVLKKWQQETGDTMPEHLTPDWYVRETTTGERTQNAGKRGEMPGSSQCAPSGPK